MKEYEGLMLEWDEKEGKRRRWGFDGGEAESFIFQRGFSYEGCVIVYID